MNKKNYSLLLTLITLVWLTALPGYGQVTIGSDNAPRAGALLDLQMDSPSLSITSTKGLGLPRVVLTAVDSLMPMFAKDVSYISGATKNETDALHTGLVVYNTVERRYLCKGAYVWDGERWTILHPISRPEITVDDVDGNTYRARWFGDACDGAYWTVDDLRTKKQPNGDPIAEFGEGGITDPQVDISYLMYPENNSSTYTLNPKLGLFYSLPAALNAKSVSDGRDHGNDPKQKEIQGICPNGWHLPSDYEWTTLEKEIALNPHKYSTSSDASWSDSYYTDSPPTNSDEQFEDGTAWRGTHGIKMISSTISDIYMRYSPTDPDANIANHRDPSDVYYQQSLGTSNGKGFDVSLYGAGNEIGTHVVDYWSGYWTSSNIGNNDVAWFRFFNPAGDEPSSLGGYKPGVKRKYNAYLDTENGSVYYYKYAFNVRCMKYVF